MEQLFNIMKEDFVLGLCVILLTVIYKLMRYIRTTHKDQIADQKAAIGLLEVVKVWLESNEKAFDRFTHQLGQTGEKLDMLVYLSKKMDDRLE